mmetsp:Transcript_27989/g.42335  ORF Transcript_27989/g.42335 Transcript_27989/m.42335 type:complete len:135 (-) Transcript_27989:111-515(-)
MPRDQCQILPAVVVAVTATWGNICSRGRISLAAGRFAERVRCMREAESQGVCGQVKERLPARLGSRRGCRLSRVEKGEGEIMEKQNQMIHCRPESLATQCYATRCRQEHCKKKENRYFCRHLAAFERILSVGIV